MIEFLWDLWQELWGYLTTNFDPFRDTADIFLVALGVYWLLLLMPLMLPSAPDPGQTAAPGTSLQTGAQNAGTD